ncbi:MAG: hypothetical protein NZ482_06380 [Gloeomargarita sp. SKYG98]|nr:hypothetical protein [Gloeomargarita sp. SKYG98]
MGKLLGTNTLGLREYLEGTDKLKLLTYFVGVDIPSNLDLGEIKQLREPSLTRQRTTRRFRTHCLCILGAWVVRRCREFPDSLETYLVNSGYIEKIKEFLGGLAMPKFVRKAEQRIPKERQQRAAQMLDRMLQELEQSQDDTLMAWIKAHAEQLRKLSAGGYTHLEIAKAVKDELGVDASANYLARLIGRVITPRKKTKAKTESSTPDAETKAKPAPETKAKAEDEPPAPETKAKTETKPMSIKAELLRLSPE